MDIRHRVKELEAVIARYKGRAEKAEAQLAELAAQARADWLEENDPQDGTDCVTPYDEYLYRTAPPVPLLKCSTHTCAAPPVDLAALVPPMPEWDDILWDVSCDDVASALSGAEYMRDEMLRRIEQVQGVAE